MKSDQHGPSGADSSASAPSITAPVNNSAKVTTDDMLVLDYAKPENEIAAARKTITVASLFEAIKKYGPLIAVLPVFIVFLGYVYDRGTADAFAVPSIFVRPDPRNIYEAALLATPIAIIFIVMGLSAVTGSFSSIGKPSKTTTSQASNFAFLLAGRAIFAIIAGPAAYYFFEPAQDESKMFLHMAYCVLGFFVVSSAPLVVVSIIRRITGAKDDTPSNAVLWPRVMIGIVAAAVVAYIVTTAYSSGYSNARKAAWHYVLPGHSQEIVLLQSADGYVTADYDTKTNTLLADYRWREWTEDRLMILTRTGALKPLQALNSNDARLSDPDAAEGESTFPNDAQKVGRSKVTVSSKHRHKEL